MKKCACVLLAVSLIFAFVGCGEDQEKNGSDNGAYSSINDNTSFINVTEISHIVDPDDPLTGTWMDVFEDVIFDFYTFYGDGTGIFEHGDTVTYLEYDYTDTVLTLRTFPDTLYNPRVQYLQYKIENGELQLVFEDGTEKTWYWYESE